MTAEGRDTGSLRPSDILSSVKEKRTLLERILSVFPGYRGYKEKELLRETDKLIRDVVYRNMKEVSDRIRNLYRDALSSLGLSQEVRMLERLSMRADAFSERIRHATYGYAPFMNIVKVDEEALLKLMDFDAGLADQIKELRERVKSAEDDLSSGKLTLDDVRRIESAIGALEEVFNRRDEVLSGLSGD